MIVTILPTLFAFCLADEACNIVAECNVDITQRLSALENDMENVKVQNSKLKSEVEYVKAENVDLKNQVEILKHENAELSNDILEIEKIVMPGKIPASCQEHRDRGATESGKYQIKPTVDIEPFFVTCDFRKCYQKW